MRYNVLVRLIGPHPGDTPAAVGLQLQVEAENTEEAVEQFNQWLKANQHESLAVMDLIPPGIEMAMELSDPAQQSHGGESL